MIVSLGSTSADGANCPAGGDWNTWCQCMFANDPTNLSKCQQWRPGAPWTDVGAALRGIPKTGSIVASATQSGGFLESLFGGGSAASSGQQAPVSSGASVMGLSKWVAIGGAALLGVGLLYRMRK